MYRSPSTSSTKADDEYINHPDDGDYDDYDILKAQDSDDDDDDEDNGNDENIFSKTNDSGKKRKQGGWGYTTFGNEGGNVGISKRSMQDDALYGVFGDSTSSEEDEKEEFNWRRERRRRKINGGDMNKEMEFVPSSASPKDDGERKETESASEQQKEDLGETEMDIANAKFLSLLSKGRGTNQNQTKPVSNRSGNDDQSASSFPSRPKTCRNEEQEEHNETFAAGLGSGLGFGSQQPRHQPHSSSFSYKSQPPRKKMSPSSSIGNWEKHTKGIGMKLLSKMGFTGSGGLGSAAASQRQSSTTAHSVDYNAPSPGNITDKEQGETTTKPARMGISRPVEIVVRPSNLGLGFGNFKEANTLKANRVIESEIRGEVSSEQVKTGAGIKKVEPDSLLDRLLAEEEKKLKQKDQAVANEKKKKVENSIPRKKERVFASSQKDTSVTTTTQMKIIDMRGPQHLPTDQIISGIAPTAANTEVPLGEELLHNITLLVNTDDARIHSVSQLISSAKNKLESLSANKKDWDARLDQLHVKKERLDKVQRILLQIEEHIENRGRNNDGKSALWTDLKGLIKDLQSNFTPEERTSLHISHVILPTILGPVIKCEIANWEPLQSPQLIVRLLHQWKGVFQKSSEDMCGTSLVTDLLIPILQPKVKNAIVSQWDVTDTKPCLLLYKTLHIAVISASANIIDEHIFMETPQNGRLAVSIVDDLMANAIYPKLSRAVNQWKLNSSTTPMHTWILPWVPYMDKNTHLTPLLADVRRKLQSTLKKMPSKLKMDTRISLDLFLPWKGLIPFTEFHTLVSEHITPYLARALSQMNFLLRDNKSDQEFSPVEMAIKWQNAKLLPPHHIQSLLEGEILNRWIITLYNYLSSFDDDNTKNMDAVVSFYQMWKSRFPTDILQTDLRICEYFYTGLRMMLVVGSFTSQEGEPGNSKDLLEELKPPSLTLAKIHYGVVLARRLKEARLLSEKKERDKKSSSINDGPGTTSYINPLDGTVTFRQVVEDFAHHNGILLQPKMGGATYFTKDGKQVYTFGGVIQVYLDKNVVFALQEDRKEWRPISLNDLLAKNQANRESL